MSKLFTSLATNAESYKVLSKDKMLQEAYNTALNATGHPELHKAFDNYITALRQYQSKLGGLENFIMLAKQYAPSIKSFASSALAKKAAKTDTDVGISKIQNILDKISPEKLESIQQVLQEERLSYAAIIKEQGNVLEEMLDSLEPELFASPDISAKLRDINMLHDAISLAEKSQVMSGAQKWIQLALMIIT